MLISRCGRVLWLTCCERVACTVCAHINEIVVFQQRSPLREKGLKTHAEIRMGRWPDRYDGEVISIAGLQWRGERASSER